MVVEALEALASSGRSAGGAARNTILSLLLISPGDPWAAKGSGAQSGLAWSASPAAVDRAVAVARRCPRNQPSREFPTPRSSPIVACRDTSPICS